METILFETLVEKIFSQFENINIKDIYTDKFLDELKTLADEYNIYIEFNIKPNTKVNGDTKVILNSEETGFDYQIIIDIPKVLNKQDLRDLTNTFLHEFTHAVIYDVIRKLIPETKAHRILLKFDSIKGRPFAFDIDDVTKENCEKFLNYIFSTKERAVYAFFIAYSCYYHRQYETLKKLFELNKKIIIDYSSGIITHSDRQKYINKLRDEKIFLFQIQYAVYFLNERHWNFKLNSFMHLIDKYIKRIEKFSKR